MYRTSATSVHADEDDDDDEMYLFSTLGPWYPTIWARMEVD